MRFTALLCIVFLGCVSLFAAEPVTVQSDAAGVTITIDRAAVQTERQTTQSTVQFQSRYSSAVSAVSAAGAQLRALEFAIAVPDGPLPQLSVLVGKEEDVAVLPGGGAAHEPSAQIFFVGVQRGVRIARVVVSPYRFDSVTGRLSAMTSGRVVVAFERSLRIAREEQPQADAHLFAAVANKEYIAALRSNAEKPQALPIDDENTWYSPEGVFVKLSTTRDGVARVRYEDIVAAEPAFSGVVSSSLHLLHNGKPYPYYPYNDADGVFNAGDVLIFLGRRAEGDSTWYDHYTSENNFYLTVNTAQQPLQLSWLTQPDNTVAELKTVSIDEHIEQEKQYSLGDDVFDSHIATLHRSETVFGEGWFWGYFSYDPNGSQAANFEHKQLITPSENPSDILSIGYHYHAVSNNRVYAPNHLTGYFLNGVEVGRDEPYTGYRDVAFEADIPASDLFAGINALRLRALGVPEYRNQPNYTEVGALDYFTIRGKARPFAFRGKLAFSTESLTDNSRVRMVGFQAASALAIDTVSGAVLQIEGTPGTTVRLGARTGATVAMSVAINDSAAVYVPQAGLSLAIAQPGNFAHPKTESYTNPTVSRQLIVNNLNDAPDGSIIAVAAAGVDIHADIRAALEALGSQQIQSTSSRTAWVFAVRKGSAEAAAERLVTDTVATQSVFIDHSDGASYSIPLRLSAGQPYHIVANDEAAVETAAVTQVGRRNLRERSLQADVIIITHRNFKEQADSLARYRRERNGVSVEVVDAEDIYTQFSFGRKSPHAIKQFLSYAYANWTAPALRYLVLLGDASWDARNVSDGAVTRDYIPSYGRPVSDYWYSLVDGDDWLPEFAVGRISVDNASQAQDVVNKIVEYEALQKRPWMKRFLLLSGGQGAQERRFFRNNTLLQMDKFLIQPPFCSVIDTVFKDNDDQASVSQSTQIRNKINAGAVWVSYVGHASPVTFDMDFGRANDLSNGNRYPVLATYSCQTAAFAEPNVTGKNEDFVREPHNGFIGAFGTTGFGEVNVDYETANNLYTAIMFDSLRSLGDILFYAKSRMGVFAGGDLLYQNTLSQHSLIGDPLLEIAIDRTTDLYLTEDDIVVTNNLGSTVISENDSVAMLRSWVRNAGTQARFLVEEGDTLTYPVQVLIVHDYEGTRDSLWVEYSELCADVPFTQQLRIAGQPGVHYLALIADPNKYSPETNRSNNTVYDTLVVYPARAFALDPLPYWNVDADAPVFRLVNPLNIGALTLEFAVSMTGNPNDAAMVSADSDVRYTEAYTQWSAPQPLSANVSYWLHVRTKDKNNEYGAWVDIPFTAQRNVPTAEVRWTLRRSAHFAAGSMVGFVAQDVADSAEVRLKNYTVPVKLRSNGNSPRRDLLIDINNVMIVDTTTYRTGFNLAVLPRGSTVPRAYRWYYTFTIPNPAAEYNSSDLIRFLRDSVADGETLLLAVFDESFAGPVTKEKNLDSLADALKIYGSQITDSLLAEGGWRSINSSYVLIARRGELLAEMWKKDSVEKTGVELVYDLDIESLNGVLRSPVVGPAMRWNSVQLAVYNNSSEVVWKTKAVGRKSDGTEDMLAEIDGTAADLSFVDAAQYPFVRFEVETRRPSAAFDPVLTALQCSFVPTAEFAALSSETGPLANDVLRGEEVPMRTRVQNISRRVASQPARIDVDVRPRSPYNAPPLLFTIPLVGLQPDEIYDGETLVPTAALAPASVVDVVAYSGGGEEELYLFNNRQKYEIRSYEDTVKPRIVVEMDGRELHEDGYVALRPAARVRVFDNSPLRMSASDKVVVRLNGKYLDNDTPNMLDYVFTALPTDEEHVRADFQALLEPGYNSLRVVAEDATGNRDTLDVTFQVAEKAVMERVYVHPNPFAELMEVRFVVGEQQKPEGGEALVYDAMGRLVRRIILQPVVGENTAVWDAADNERRRVASGVYLIRVNVRTASGVLESPTQKVVRVQ